MDEAILGEFRDESKQILKELSDILERMERDTTCKDNPNFTEFSKRIDRITGSSKTISLLFPSNPGLKEMSKISALCKALGYKATEVDNPLLVPIFCGFWADAIEVLTDVLNSLEDAIQVEKIVTGFMPVVSKRLEWLSNKIKTVSPQKAMNPQEINDLLSDLFK